MPTDSALAQANNQGKAIRAGRLAEQEQRVIKYADGERSIPELAVISGAKKGTVWLWVQKHGLKVRSGR